MAAPDHQEFGWEVNVKRVAFLLLSLLIVAAWVAGQAQTAKQKYPPRFPQNPPRAGTKKLFENERVIVWEENLSTEHYMHQHVLDSLFFYIQDAPVEHMDENGQIELEPPFRDRTQNGPSFGGNYTRSGRGPHSERSVDPNKLRRIFSVELKGTALLSCREWSTDPLCK